VARLKITDDLEALVAILPPPIAASLQAANRAEDLLEVILDLGRRPEARFFDSEIQLSEQEVSQAEIDFVVNLISDFGDDNRAGIERTLHRISAIRNREGSIVGLTCRVGRAVYGTIDIISDIVESGKSTMLLGRPGVGKTTMLREVARVLAEKRRVVIVDTSNEIGGDGDIPHPAIGRARRMQVAASAMQHAVMIEAVENHMPEVIVIDEISTELEAAAARTIAERGVQLVGTAHGNTLDNLMMNPTLCDLVGGIQTVTLSDEEARRRGTQKSVLERKAPPTFEVVVEIQDWDRLAVRHNVAEAVDAILRGRILPAEVRHRDPDGEIHIEQAGRRPELALGEPEILSEQPEQGRSTQALHVFAYGISKNRLREASKALNTPVIVVKDLRRANVLMTSKSYYRKHPRTIADAERAGLPIYVLRRNTIAQMEDCLADMFGLSPVQDPFATAVREAQEAIDKILCGSRSTVRLSPREAFVRRKQHEMAREANLISYSNGKEPYRRVNICQDQ
jgi:stage III sporulation protein SpoIIIAA